MITTAKIIFYEKLCSKTLILAKRVSKAALIFIGSLGIY